MSFEDQTNWFSFEMSFVLARSDAYACCYACACIDAYVAHFAASFCLTFVSILVLMLACGENQALRSISLFSQRYSGANDFDTKEYV